ncbi:MAG TPA: sensor histidine kinase [Xanthomonadaceae bacterium]|jgi:two-component system sensor histidine kinase DesK|nr:sensor histidine kinase [Xanthomonadaceae bacterium]
MSDNPNMIDKLFRTAPDSIASLRNRDGKANVAILLNLLWSLWFFGDLMYEPVPGVSWTTTTAIGFPALVALWLLATTRPMRQLLFYCIAMALLGYAVMPWNHSGGTACVIYACTCLAFAGSVRFSLSMMGAVLAVSVAEMIGLQWPAAVIVCTTSMTIAISGGNLARRINDVKDAEIRLSHDEVRRLAATAERERIGRDLHDLLGHTLSLIALKSELAGKLLGRDPVAARREIADVERITRDALAQVRSAVSGMRAAGLVGELASARLMLECAGVRFAYSGFEYELPSAQESCLALALREAVTNIQRHARATNAEAALVVDGDDVQLTVRDDGNGAIAAHGNGLNGMRERVEVLGGSLRIDATRGHGTQLILRLPKITATNVISLSGAKAAVRQASA